MDIKAAASAYNQIASIVPNTGAGNSITGVEDKSATPSFSELIRASLSNAVDSGHKAEEISTLALMGKADITELATAVSKAELALNTVVAVRDKVISAYQQIMQMPI